MSAAEALHGSRWEPEPTLEMIGECAEIVTHPLPSRASLWDLIAAICRTCGTHRGEDLYKTCSESSGENLRFQDLRLSTRSALPSLCFTAL